MINNSKTVKKLYPKSETYGRARKNILDTLMKFQKPSTADDMDIMGQAMRSSIEPAQPMQMPMPMPQQQPMPTPSPVAPPQPGGPMGQDFKNPMLLNMLIKSMMGGQGGIS